MSNRIVIFPILLLLLAILPVSGQTWHPTAGPPGSILALIEHGGAFYAGGEHGRVFRSSDGGGSWTPAGRDLPDGPVTAFASSGGSLYAGVDVGEVYRSDDEGRSWRGVKPSTVGRVSGIVVKGDTLLVGIDGVVQDYKGKVERSTDGGATWATVYSGVHVTGIGALGSYIIIATEGNGIYRSADNGTTWTKMIPAGSYLDYLTISDGKIYTGQSLLIRSADSGVTWSKLGDELTGVVRAVAVHGDTLLAASDMSYPGTGGIFRSVDGGETFRQIKAGTTTTQFHAAAIAGGMLLAGSDHGVYRMGMAGETWEPINNGINNSSINEITYFDGKLYAAAEDLFVSSDGGESWSASQDGSIGSEFTSLVPKGDYLFGGNSHGLYRRGRKGSWSLVALPGITTDDGCHSIAVFGDDIFAGVGVKVFRSSDNGATWKLANKGRPEAYANAMVVHRGMLYAASGTKVYLTTDRGESWRTPMEYGEGAGIVTLASSDTNLYIGDLNGSYRSTDSGATWTFIRGDIPGIRYTSRMVIAGAYLYAATYDGVFRTSDQGTHWERINDGLNDTMVYTLYLNDGVLYAGVHGGGVSSLDGVLAAPAAAMRELPGASLGQNHPNPFSGVSSIDFHLDRGGAVSIALYDPLGREVATVLSATLPAGDHTVTVDGSGLASGIYLYRLRAHGTEYVRRMLVR